MTWQVRVYTVMAGMKIRLDWEGTAETVADAAAKALNWCEDHSCGQLARVDRVRSVQK